MVELVETLAMDLDQRWWSTQFRQSGGRQNPTVGCVEIPGELGMTGGVERVVTGSVVVSIVTSKSAESVTDMAYL